MSLLRFLGSQSRAFFLGFYDGAVTALKKYGDVPCDDQVSISTSEARKEADNVISTLDQLCTHENMIKLGYPSAMLYCAKAASVGAIRGACLNLLV